MPKRRNSFAAARQALRLAAMAYAGALERTARSGTVLVLEQLYQADQALQDAAIDFTAMAQLRLAGEDKKRKAGP